MHFPWLEKPRMTESVYFVGIVVAFLFRTLPRDWARERDDLRLCDLLQWRFHIDFAAHEVIKADPTQIRNSILAALSKYDVVADARSEMEAILE